MSISNNLKVISKDEIVKKNIAVYMNYALGSPPLELHISTIQDLLLRDNAITVYVCDSELKSCTANPLRSPSVCRYCKFRAEDGLSKLKGVFEIKYLTLGNNSQKIPVKVEDSLKLGVMSSMASAVKAQTYEQLNAKWKKFHDNMLMSSKDLYNYFVCEIKKNNYDYVFMFNGRFGDVKPVLEAARHSKTGYGLCEVKKSLHEVVFINELIHSIDGNTRRAIEAYAKDVKKANLVAESFFSKKVKNEDTGDPVYTKNQELGNLPEVIKTTEKKVIAIYPTTDDEYKFIGAEWDGFVPEDQVNEIKLLAENLSENDYILIVKMHPNQAHTAENVLERYLELERRYNHVFVEDPLSKKDTYALMFRSDYIINFASTIGVEACYAGKIVISIGDTTFSKMNISYKARSGANAAYLIVNKKLKPKSKRGAIIWGNYLSTYSEGLSSFSRVSNGDYRFNNKKIGQSKVLRFLQLPSKLRLEMEKPGFKIDSTFFKKGINILLNVLKGKWTVS